MKPSPYGTHRVMSPQGVLPQAADKLDNTMILHANEILIDVDVLNIDSASFTQIKQACDHDPKRMEAMILSIVEQRGKMQNPVTGSGGMLLGRIAAIGCDLHTEFQVGDEIATLVSLSLTPLCIEQILCIHMESDQVDVVAQAILFETGIAAKLPKDLNRKLALSALDVAGAPAQVDKLVKEGDLVVILGAAGKSGLLCAYQAKKKAGPHGQVVGVLYDNSQRSDLERLGVCDNIVIADATKALEVLANVLEVTDGQKADVTINVVNVPNTEMASILATKDSGTVYFFGMATSFQKAALGAEGVASEAKLMIGNGYTFGHAELTLNLLRESDGLREIFTRRYGGKD
jgi:L-erythro-3,5-diaminohexanoate dehydrogenase